MTRELLLCDIFFGHVYIIILILHRY